MATTPIAVTADAEELGFDAARLHRIDRHFDRYVAEGKIPGYLVSVAREGEVVHVATGGHRDVARQLPVEADTLFRIYSMTKPITSVVLMSFFEEGRFKLSDPVEWYIPAFKDARVYAGGSPTSYTTVPALEPVRIWHLLTHTAGLTYGFNYVHPCDAIYRNEGLEWGAKHGISLEEACDLWARLPLRFQPGSAWNYSVATDVCGRLCEIFGDASLPEVFAERILKPLGMHETSFVCEGDDLDRLADLYLATPSGGIVQAGPMAEWAKRPATAPSGGGGLISSAADYHRFTTMLLRGGSLDGVRILSPRTLDFMAANHLPGGIDLAEAEVDGFSESPYNGVGFGLGFAVMLNPLASKMFASAGDFYWGGMASTAFYVDPTEQLTVQFFTQLVPSTTYPIREELRQLVFQAITE